MIWFFQVAGVDMEMVLTIAMEEMVVAVAAVVVVVVSYGNFVSQVFSLQLGNMLIDDLFFRLWRWSWWPWWL